MSQESLKRLLNELSEELKDAPVDAQLTVELQKLETDIHALLSSANSDQHNPGIIDQAKMLEIEFANRHPTAEKLIQEVIDILSKIGI